MKKISTYVRCDNKPYMIMMCGLPGSGKSTYAENNIEIDYNGSVLKPKIHSSDGLRKELYGNEGTQGDNNFLFNELHKRIKNDLLAGNDVVYDATSIRKKQRIQFLKELEKIPCRPVCICMATTYELCLFNNSNRDRNVPIEVIQRMQMNWQPPHYNEGFLSIDYIFSYLDENNQISHECQKDKYSLGAFFSVANDFDQENHHHSLTLGEHCSKTGEYIQAKNPNNFWLLVAALLHDNGKLFTKTRKNAKGIEDGNCHYYQHHCVGAYNVVFYLHCFSDISIEDIVYVANLVFYHMHPYNEWRQSTKALNRDKARIGDSLYNDIMMLHEADVSAH